MMHLQGLEGSLSGDTPVIGVQSLTVCKKLETDWAAPDKDTYRGDDTRDGHVYKYRPTNACVISPRRTY